MCDAWVLCRRSVVMDTGMLLRGLIIGFSIAAPVGPIGVLCIRRTLAQGRAVGLASGLGAATADAVYGAVAGFGLAVLPSFLVSQGAWLRLFGGLFLCWLGYQTFRATPASNEAPAGEPEARSGKPGLFGAYVSTFLLTITNPATILSFTAIF